MSRPGAGQAAVPFQTNGSFSTPYTAVQQQQERDRWHQSEQQPAELASAAAGAAPSDAAPEPEEGEIPFDHHQRQQQQAHQYQPDNSSDAQQWQLQQQYDAYPVQQNEQQYQQAAYASYQRQQPYQHQYQHQGAPAAAAEGQAAEEKDFNSCDAWFGPWPGFCFKLGPQGLGYYRDKPLAPAAATAKAVAGTAAPAKPKIILGNNSIIKGLAPKPGGIAKRKKQEEAAKPAYLREMEAWQKQACSDDDRRRSLVK